MRTKAKNIDTNTVDFKTEVLAKFANSQEVFNEYQAGLKEVAKFCGKLDMLIASGLSPSEAKEAIIVLDAMAQEERDRENRII